MKKTIMNIVQTQTLNKKVKDAYLMSESFIINNKEVILHGSDQHLDQINSTTKYFNELILVLTNLNNLFEANFPSNEKAANDLKFGLHSLHSSLIVFLSKLKNDNITSSSFKDCINRLEIESDQLNEYINDLNEYIISQEDVVDDDFFNGL